MSKHTLLDNVNHHNIKIIDKYSPEFGNNVGSVLTFSSEFSDIQKEYPILFRKDKSTDKFISIALLGFQQDENLFLQNEKWQANYIPAVVAREPFSIGFQSMTNNNADNTPNNSAVIHIDMDSPKVSETEGQPLFTEIGGHSPYLNKVTQTLETIHRGMQLDELFFSALKQYELLEPIKLDIELNNGQKHSITGNYSINQQKLNNLSGNDLAKLNRAGILQGIFLTIASLDNVHNLIRIKNATL